MKAVEKPQFLCPERKELGSVYFTLNKSKNSTKQQKPLVILYSSQVSHNMPSCFQLCFRYVLQTVPVITSQLFGGVSEKGTCFLLLRSKWLRFQLVVA